MKALLLQGCELHTDDAVAAAVVAYAMTLAKRDDRDVIVIPVVRNGRSESCTLLLTPGSVVGAVTLPDPAVAVPLPEAEATAREIASRSMRRTALPALKLDATEWEADALSWSEWAEPSELPEPSGLPSGLPETAELAGLTGSAKASEYAEAS